jgi:hypothetical protein
MCEREIEGEMRYRDAEMNPRQEEETGEEGEAQSR